VCVFFPDPWPKARHHKRRIIQPDFLAACARVFGADGELWVVSDWPDYVFHSIATLYTSPHFALNQTGMVAAACKVNHLADKEAAAGLGPHHLAVPPSWWVPTKYQAKAAAQGRAPWFVGAVKK
jgi:tRNA G46 methylase TrmB